VWLLLAALLPQTTSIKVCSGTIQLVSGIRPRQKCVARQASTLPEGYAFTGMDENEVRKRKFAVVQVEEGTKYTSPSGPVLLLSKRASEDGKLFWRFRVSGNNSWSIGVILDSNRNDNQELFAHGKVGLDSQGLVGGVMQSHNMHGSWVSAAFDNKTSTAKFTVRGKTIEQTATFKGPVRLALSTFAGTIVTMGQKMEHEIMINDGHQAEGAELTVGAEVQLSHDYTDYDDASSGPLKPGVVGTLIEDDSSSKPYKVQAPNGKQWWYRKNAIVSTRLGSNLLGESPEM
jgi:hypothetical protein